jgi:hypothetical protein
VKKIQDAVEQGIDRILDWAIAAGKSVLSSLGFGGRKEEPDERTEAQKADDLRTGATAAEQLVDNKQLSARERRNLLGDIRKRFRMSELALVVEKSEGVRERVHVHAVVNPTYDGVGKIIDKEPLDKTVIEAEIGPAPSAGGPPRAGFENVLDPPPLGYQRAHLIGAGFGAESPLGVLYAPTRVNQELQNKGIEGFIRNLYATRIPGARLFLRATAVAQPGRSEYLGRVVYQLSVQVGAGPVTDVFEFRIVIQNRQLNPRVVVQSGGLDEDALAQISTRAQQLLASLALE